MVSPYAEKHSCPVCRHAVRQEIETLYIDWEDVPYLAKQYQVRPEDLEAHVFALNLERERAGNTRGFYRALLRKKGPDLLEAKQLDVNLMLTALKQLDKVSGNEQAPSRNEKDIDRTKLTDTLLDKTLQMALSQGIPLEAMSEALAQHNIQVPHDLQEKRRKRLEREKPLE